MKELLIISVSITALLFSFWSCNHIMNDDSNHEILDEATVVISANEAALVAQRFMAQSFPETKTGDTNEVRITPFYDDEGSLEMYIASFDSGGFVVVSATKNYYPVLGYSNTGTFKSDDIIPPVRFYLNEIVKDIKYCETLPADSLIKYHALWSDYEMGEQTNNPRGGATKSGEINALISSMMYQWDCAGYSYYSLSDAVYYIPADIYDDFVSEAEMEANPDFDYMVYSFVTIENVGIPSSYYAPMILSTWDQDGNYAYPYDAPSGCGTVALGQIMFYYTFPSGYWDWNNIAATYGTEDTRKLIHHIKSWVSPLGGSSSIAVLNNLFLQSSGYSTSFIQHNNSRVVSSIQNGHPVYMSGQINNSLTNGHAWVCEGFQSLGSNTTYYTLWVIDIDPYPTYSYAPIDTQLTNSSLPEYYYMNWGWSGSYNGWFITDNVQPGSSNFSTMRYDIVDITPNNNE